MNCYCRNDFDLRCVCHPIADYRRLRKDKQGLKYDFRKCPMRFVTCIQFIMNDYELYKTIETGTTEKKRIAILKKIITKKFKLTVADFEIILNDYITQYDNLINNLQERPQEDDEEEDEPTREYCCGKNCEQTDNLINDLGYNRYHHDEYDLVLNQLFCEPCGQLETTNKCKDCSGEYHYSDLSYKIMNDIEYNTFYCEPCRKSIECEGDEWVTYN